MVEGVNCQDGLRGRISGEHDENGDRDINGADNVMSEQSTSRSQGGDSAEGIAAAVEDSEASQLSGEAPVR